MDNLNLGIIGPGRVAHRFAAACQNLKNINLWSIFARDYSKAKAFADNYSALASVSSHDNIDAFLSDPDLHAVIVATPDKYHTTYAFVQFRSPEVDAYEGLRNIICMEGLLYE